MLRPHPLCRALPGPLSDTPQSHGDSYDTVNCCCPHHPSAAGLQPVQPPLTSLQHSRRACSVGTSPWPSSASSEAEASPNCPAQLGKYSIKARASGNLFYPAFLALTFPKSSPQLEEAGIDLTGVSEANSYSVPTCTSTGMNHGLRATSAEQRKEG